MTDAPMQSQITAHDVETGAPISWSAVIAGALVGLAVTFAVAAVGAGFGTRLDSPWRAGWGGGAVNMVGVWLIAAQAAGGAMAGYLAGRMRGLWTNVHGHEVHFRDTAHGLMAWALAVVVGVVAAPVSGATAAAEISPAAASEIALYFGLALLVGAFMATAAAALGGMRREEMARRGF